MSPENPVLRRSFVVAITAAAFAFVPSSGCSGRRQDVSSPGTGPSIWAPPGAVASFLVEPGEPKPVRTYGDAKATWADLRSSGGHQKHIGLDKVLCRDCHQKGFQEKGGGNCGRAGCHETQAKHTHGAVDGADRSGCASCHSFEPGKSIPACMECHAKARNGRDERKLAAIVDGHLKADCGKCHNPHKEPLSQAADCVSCHKQKATAHAAHKDSKGCSDCHSTHSLAIDAKAKCVTCHKEPAGDKPAGHASCLTCHKAHAEEKGALACGSCHKQRALAETTAKPHQACTSCHVAHDPKATTDAVCSKCHAKVKLHHAKSANATGTSTTLASYAGKSARSANGCGACHAAHPGDKGDKVQPCTTCHTKLGDADVGVHAKSLACTSCHGKHEFTAPDKATIPAFCGKCHEDQSKLVAGTKGHLDCRSCHASTHKETAAPSCETCHKAELNSAPKGHQSCDACHAKHSGKTTAKAACTGCHAKMQKGPHVAIKTGCQTCHRPHGPNGPATPPTCQSCHDTAKLAGLHTVKSHGDCLKCHSSHDGPKASHDNCTHAGCHANRQQHQPTAKSCVACHVFKPQQTGG